MAAKKEVESKRTMIAVKVRCDDTDADLEDMFRRTMRDIENLQGHSDSVHVTFFNDEFDRDPRELYQIDSIKSLFKRLIGMGAYGLIMHPGKFNMSHLGMELHKSDLIKNMFTTLFAIAYTTDGVVDPEAMFARIQISCNLFNSKFDPV